MRQVASLLGPFTVWDNDHLGHVLEAGQFWDAQLKPFIDNAAIGHQTQWAIDIGANVGWFTVYLSQLFAHVVAVEAHPITFQCLQINCLKLRDLESRVTLLEGVAYDRMGAWFAPLGTEAQADKSSAVFVRVFGTDGIPSIALDHCLPDYDHPIALIKCDAQGGDLRALRGCRQIITRHRPIILFEYERVASTWYGDDWDDYREFFKRLNYRVIQVRQDISDYVAYPEEV